MDKGLLKSGKPRILTLNFFLLGMIGCGILLRIVYLGKREFWYDEVLSLALSTGHKMRYFTTDGIAVALADYQSLLQLPKEQGLGGVAQTVATLLRGLSAEPHPALSFLSQHFWLRWWGRGEAAMRSLEMLTSILAIASLLLGKWYGWNFADPLTAILGSVVIMRWAYTLCRKSGIDLITR